MAATVTERVVEEIKARTDIAELIESYGIAVRRAGSSQKACCPFHHERTPSFHINASRGFYHCFGCGESGDAIKFVEKMEGLTFLEAVKKLADKCGVKIETKEDPELGKRTRLMALMAELAQFYHRCLLKTKEAQLARDYLKKRDLDERTCEEWLIGYAPEGVSTVLKWAEKYGYTEDELVQAGVVKAPTGPGDRGYHRFGGRLMFSIRDKQGRVVAFSGRQLVEKKNSGKYVNSPETPIFRKSNVLFGFDRAAGNIARSPHREAIACEGQIDTIRLHLCGFPVAVASQGTAFTEEHARMLKRVCDSMTLVYDDDSAGHKATVKVAAMMLALEVPVRVVSLPDGDDPDSFLRTKGADAFRALLDKAESIVSFQCRTERAKESHPDSIDAVARISKAVLGTIAACPSAVLKASMVAEAAKFLGLPAEALREELAKTKATVVANASGGVRDSGDDSFSAEDGETVPSDPIVGEEASAANPPCEREFAFMEFLIANERDVEIDGLVGEFLPVAVFTHDFTKRFTEAWRADVASADADNVGEFGAKLSARERTWFDRVIAEGGANGVSTIPGKLVAQDFIRGFWSDELKRRRGSLPVSGDAESDGARMTLTMDMKRIKLVKWHEVKEIVRKWTAR